MQTPYLNLSKLALLMLSVTIFSCKSGSVNPFKPASPHQQYQRKLTAAGLDQTAMGNSWNTAARQSLEKALPISLPFKTAGYFAAEKTPAAAYRFPATRGQKIKISLTKKPVDQFLIYVDVWEERSGNPPKLLASADTLNNVVELDIEVTGHYLIRLQPELLRSGSYTLEISNGPSLAFPVQKGGAANIQSFYGDGRDANARKHEGIDIFSSRLTPVLAISAGTVTRVNQNNLGGNVVWMRPAGKDYTLYYAHLDQQIAVEGQQVNIGDTLGLMGNTGNARSTSPHLHFGIYTSEGAIDPLPFVKPVTRNAANITAPLNALNTTVRTIRKTSLLQSAIESAAISYPLPAGTILQVNGAAGNWYEVELPNGNTGYIQNTLVTPVSKPLRKLKVTIANQMVFDQPDSGSAIKMNLTAGSTVGILGEFEAYQLVVTDNQQTGWISLVR